MGKLLTAYYVVFQGMHKEIFPPLELYHSATGLHEVKPVAPLAAMGSAFLSVLLLLYLHSWGWRVKGSPVALNWAVSYAGIPFLALR